MEMFQRQPSAKRLTTHSAGLGWVANQNQAPAAEAGAEVASARKVIDAAETVGVVIVGATGTAIETTTTIAAATTIMTTTAATTITTTISACRDVFVPIVRYLETGGRNTGDPWATRSAEW